MPRFYVFVLSLLISFIIVSNSKAAVTTVQALDFGEWVSIDNSAVYNVIINTNGSYSYDAAGFILITAPLEGIYDFSGMTPNTAIVSVVVTQTIALSGAGPDFFMVNFQETSPVSTDGAGGARVTIGATAQTSGDSASYVDQTFSGTVQIQINF